MFFLSRRETCKPASLFDAEPPDLRKPLTGEWGAVGVIRNALRVRQRRSLRARFRRPTGEDRERYEHAPLFDPFGDFFHGVAEHGDETWVIFERAWFGYPDPPKYAMFFLSASGDVVAGGDTYAFPAVWQFPPDDEPA